MPRNGTSMQLLTADLDHIYILKELQIVSILMLLFAIENEQFGPMSTIASRLILTQHSQRHNYVQGALRCVGCFCQVVFDDDYFSDQHSAVMYNCGSVQQCTPSIAAYHQFTVGKLNLDDQTNDENFYNFADSGRTGRRNAIFNDATPDLFTVVVGNDTYKCQDSTTKVIDNEDDVVLAHFLGMKDQKRVASMAELASQMNDLRMKTAKTE
uniref:Uncharacterized protein n=1 Tax=Romanomermis culicivorax TaxID=13658 RepID=A0A915JUD2_ROMCU